jgi:hypothetical protein
VLLSLIKALDGAFILFDALDECSDRKQVYELLERIRGWRVPSLHCLITSQMLVEIERRLTALEYGVILIGKYAVKADIQHHVEQQLLHNQDFARWTEPYRTEIKLKLTEKSAGM